jgi:DNA-binding SARP family transcriptional activator
VLEFRILGPLEVLDDDRPARLGGPKQRAALAILLLNANRIVSVERLADDLYAGAPPVTAVTQVQRHVSELRKVLGTAVIETRAPGYLIHVDPGRLDLDRFERWTHDAAQALDRADPRAASDLLGLALELWRGAPLADLTYESFAQTAIARLDELRLSALEQRLTAELELGRHAQVLPELEALVWDHPLRERLRGLLMVALYRDERQAEALDVYRKTRETLVADFGIEPSPGLHELERRILRQDPSLDLDGSSPPPATEPERTQLVVPGADDRIDALLSVAKPLAALPGRALIVARLAEHESQLAAAAAAVATGCAVLGSTARGAAFTSLEPARDVVRLATNYHVELVLIEEASADIAAVFAHSPADVAVFFGPRVDWGRGAGVFVPFGGSRDDWAALEVGAWLASSAEVPLRLVGTAADPSRGRRDASRLLADASLAIQRVVGVAAEPLLVAPDEDALAAAIPPATVVVTGAGRDFVSSRHTNLPVLLVHRGTRPGGLAPRDSWTRFSWSLEG